MKKDMGSTTFKINIKPSAASILLCVAALYAIMALANCQPNRKSGIDNNDSIAEDGNMAVVAKRGISCEECKILRDQCFENGDIQGPEDQFQCVRLCSSVCRILKGDTMKDSDGQSNNGLSFDEWLYLQ